ncbi:MAG: right-handed parallel beta-helix repeat-containing protein, partial [Candidatus Thermoplasmatota archaeon]|nr:right-handed parallel beta-helix repeat-containing protein [Candidatus Thermoplasmatota archaeon]
MKRKIGTRVGKTGLEFLCIVLVSSLVIGAISTVLTNNNTKASSYTIYGYVLHPYVERRVHHAAVVLWNLRTNETNVTYTNETGYYRVNLNEVGISWRIGDEIRILTYYMHYSSEDVITIDSNPSHQVDIKLRNNNHFNNYNLPKLNFTVPDYNETFEDYYNLTDFNYTEPELPDFENYTYPENLSKRSPNLTVSDVSYDKLILGNQTQLNITIKNINNETAYNVTAEVYYESNNNELLGTLSYGNIPPNETKLASVFWTPTISDINNLKIIIYTNTQKESMIVVGFYVSSEEISGSHHTIEGVPFPPRYQDWIIDRDTVVWDEPELKLYGNLIIQPGATLTFKKNVKLIMCCQWAGQYKIEVQAGGRFEILSERGAESKIGVDTTFYPYKFLVNGSLSMRHGEVMAMYGDESNEKQPGGIQLFEGSSCYIENSLIHWGSTHNIYANGCSVIVRNSNVSDAGKAGSLTNIGCGIYLTQNVSSGKNSSLYLDNTVVWDSAQHGVYAYRSGVYITGSEITENNYGVYLYEAKPEVKIYTDCLADGRGEKTINFCEGGSDVSSELLLPKDVNINAAELKLRGDTILTQEVSVETPEGTAIAFIHNNIHHAQSFTPAAQLSVNYMEIYVRWSNGTRPDDDLMVELRTDDGTGEPSEEVFAHGTISRWNTYSWCSWAGVDLSSTVTLNANVMYWVIVKSPYTTSYEHHYAWQGNSNNPYAGGYHLTSYDGGATWEDEWLKQFDLGLKVYTLRDVYPATPALYVGTIDSGWHPSALSFDGQPMTEYVQVPSSPSLNMREALTIEAFVFLEKLGYYHCPHSGNGSHRVNPRIVSKGAPLARTNQYELLVDSASKKLVCSLGGVTYGQVSYDTMPEFPIGRWVHVAATYDGKEIRLYLDGELKYVQEATGLIGITDNPLRIGAKDPSDIWCTDSWLGRMDEVRIASVALSGDEIKEDYEQGRGKTRSGIVAWYHFDEGSGNDVFDSSNNKNHGTRGGAVWCRVFDRWETIDITDALSTYIQTAKPVCGNVIVPLKITSQSAGKITISDVKIEWETVSGIDKAEITSSTRNGIFVGGDCAPPIRNSRISRNTQTGIQFEGWEPVFDDDFEDGTLNKWITDGDVSVVKTKDAYSGRYCCFFNGAYGGTIAQTVSPPVSTGSVLVDFAFMDTVHTVAGNFFYSYYLGDLSGKESCIEFVRTATAGEFEIRWYPDADVYGGYVILDVGMINTWYYFEVELSLDTKSVRIWINGIEKKAGLLTTAITEVNGWAFYQIDFYSKTYLDSVRVRKRSSVSMLGIVEDCELVGNGIGALTLYASDIEITDCNFRDNTIGIRISQFGDSNLINKCNFYRGDWGMEIIDSSYNRISASQFSASLYGGLAVRGGHNNIVECSVFSDSPRRGIDISNSAHDNQIVDCTFSNNGWGGGIRVSWDSYKNIIINNYLHHNTVGLVLYISNSNEIRNNTITDNAYGVVDCWSNNNVFENCIIGLNGRGVWLERTEKNLITNCNIFSHTNEGILLSYSNHDSIECSDIYSNEGSGIVLSHSTNSVIRYSSVYSNKGAGIALSSSTLNNRIEDCDIRDNQYGVYLAASSTTISNNVIKGNRGFGIYSTGSEVEISNNDLSDNVAPGGFLTAGIYAINTGGRIENNNIAGHITKETIIAEEKGVIIERPSGAGISLYNSYLTISDNKIFGNVEGISCTATPTSQHLKISNNKITENFAPYTVTTLAKVPLQSSIVGTGIAALDAEVIIANNNIIDNPEGIYLAGTSHASIYDNNIIFEKNIFEMYTEEYKIGLWGIVTDGLYEEAVTYRSSANWWVTEKAEVRSMLGRYEKIQIPFDYGYEVHHIVYPMQMVLAGRLVCTDESLLVFRNVESYMSYYYDAQNVLRRSSIGVEGYGEFYLSVGFDTKRYYWGAPVTDIVSAYHPEWDYFSGFTAQNATDPNCRYAFRVAPDGKLELKDSYIEHCGFASTYLYESGLYLTSNLVTIESCIFRNNYYGIIADAISLNVKASKIEGSWSGKDFYLRGNARVTTTNTTFTKPYEEHVEFGDVEDQLSILDVLWYVDVKTYLKDGETYTLKIGVDVYVFDINDRPIFAEITKLSGITRCTVRECKLYKNTKIDYTPHTFLAIWSDDSGGYDGCIRKNVDKSLIGNDAIIIILENERPTIEITEIIPAPINSYVRGNITVKGKVTDNARVAKVRLQIEDASGAVVPGWGWRPVAYESGWTKLDNTLQERDWHYVINTTQLQDGIYYIRIKASDDVGPTIESIEIHIDNTEPETTASLSGIGTGVAEVVSSFHSPCVDSYGLVYTVWDGEYLWNLDSSGRKIYKISPSNGQVISSFDTPCRYSLGLDWDGTYILNVDYGESRIYRLNPADGSIVSSTSVALTKCVEVAWDGNYAWVVHYIEEGEKWNSTVSKVDLATGEIIYSIDIPWTSCYGVTWVNGYLWATDRYGGMVYKLNPTNGQIEAFFNTPRSYPTGLTWDGKYFW